ncbi:MAG: zinc ABC transporter substrate-binding protein [Candidatus Omnitrophica bacterium]|nr:zinc ABC transporter substrate-binding protein [Candidatus Omnitrophota bacterium]
MRWLCRGGGIFCYLLMLVSAVTAAEKKTAVIATIFPLYDFARAVGGEYISLSMLLPPGVEAHAFEPKPGDMLRIGGADIFVYAGRAMEPWVDELIQGVAAPSLRVVDASTGIAVAPAAEQAGEHAAHAGHSHGQEHVDPHIWLDFDNAQTMVDTIAAALSAADPARRVDYAENARRYKERLQKLDSRFVEFFAQRGSTTIVYGGHAAFGYFSRRYGVSFVSPYRGFSPDAEPTPQNIIAMIKTVRRSGAKAVFYEEMIEPKVATIVARETGAELLLLHGAHNISKEQFAQAVTFIDLMEENLEQLRRGLSGR